MKNLFFFCAVFYITNAIGQVNESVYVRTDKSSYHTGEIMWFQVNVVDNKTLQPLDNTKVVYAEILDASNTPVLQGKIGLKNASGQGSFEILSSIRSGKYIFRAYTANMKNLSPENYFYREVTLLNVSDSTKMNRSVKGYLKNNNAIRIGELDINASGNQRNYSTREKIQLDITTASPAKLSVSVYKIDSIQLPDMVTINNSLSVASNKTTGNYVPETNGHQINGRVIDVRTGNPAPGVITYLSVPGAKQFFVATMSDVSGNVTFTEKDFYGVDEIILQAGSASDSNYIVEIADPFSNRYVEVVADSFDIFSVDNSLLVQRVVSADAQQAYVGQQLANYTFPISDTLNFYGAPDGKYKVDDYVLFTTMEDVLREYVTEVGIRMKNLKPQPFVFDRLTKKGFPESPLMLVNSVPVLDFNRFMAIDPKVVNDVEVVGQKYFRNGIEFQGVLTVSTKNGGVEDVEMGKNTTVMEYMGLQPVRTFYSPVYENEHQKKSRIPDFRNVLFWSPEIITGVDGKAKVEFYSSDLKGDYLVDIQGINNNGQAGHKTIRIKVE